MLRAGHGIHGHAPTSSEFIRQIGLIEGCFILVAAFKCLIDQDVPAHRKVFGQAYIGAELVSLDIGRAYAAAKGGIFESPDAGICTYLGIRVCCRENGYFCFDADNPA